MPLQALKSTGDYPSSYDTVEQVSDKLNAWLASMLGVAINSDDYDSIQDAVDALPNGGTVFIPAGVHTLATPVSLPTGLTKPLRILGTGGATVIKPTTAAFVHDTASAVCQNIELGNFDIDGSAYNTSTGGNNSIIGSFVDGDHGDHAGWDSIYIHDITMYDVPTDTASSSTYGIYGIGITCFHQSDGESATTISDITIERVKVFGARSGIVLNGHVYDTNEHDANITIDGVVIRDCQHIIDSAPTGFYASSGIHIGAEAKVGLVRIENFYSENNGDNGIEVNNAQDVVIRDCHLKNQWVAGYVLGNYRTPDDITRQTYKLFGNTQEQTSSIDYRQHTGILCIDQGHNFGSLLVDGYTFFSWQPNAAIFCSGESYRRIVIKNVDASYNLSWTATATFDFGGIYINDLGAGGRHTLEGIRFTMDGAITPGAYTIGAWMLVLAGPDVNYITRDVHIYASATGFNGTNRVFWNGPNSGDHVGVIAMNCSVTGSDITWNEHFATSGNNTRDADHYHVELNNSWIAPVAGQYAGRIWVPSPTAAWKNFAAIAS